MRNWEGKLVCRAQEVDWRRPFGVQFGTPRLKTPVRYVREMSRKARKKWICNLGDEVGKKSTSGGLGHAQGHEVSQGESMLLNERNLKTGPWSRQCLLVKSSLLHGTVKHQAIVLCYS